MLNFVHLKAESLKGEKQHFKSDKIMLFIDYSWKSI